MTGKTQDFICECPICYEPINMGLMTQCGHSFCGDCILEWWRMSGKPSLLSCPYCTQKITDMVPLVPYLSEEEWNTREPGEAERRSRILEEVGRYKKESERYKKESERAEAALQEEERRGTIWSRWMHDLISRAFFHISFYPFFGLLAPLLAFNIAIVIIGMIHIMYLQIRISLNDFYQTLLSQKLRLSLLILSITVNVIDIMKV